MNSGPYLRGSVVLLLLLTAASGSARGKQQEAAPGTEKDWVLTWSDEFNGADGSRPDPAKWKFTVGGNGWGNSELEYYTDGPQNAVIRGGSLVIRAVKETFTGPNNVKRKYTSARISTKGLFDQVYGRFEARIKIPRGQGMWPAFWMMGIDEKTIGWPACGEIDVMENVGKEPSTVHGSMHGPGYSHDRGYSASYKLPGGAQIADDFHVFAIEWEPNVVRFYVDRRLYATFTPDWLPAGMKWVFDHPFYIILNLAVGGDWPGPPNANTVFPQEMLVDYVRVYKRSPARH